MPFDTDSTDGHEGSVPVCAHIQMNVATRKQTPVYTSHDPYNDTAHRSSEPSTVCFLLWKLNFGNAFVVAVVFKGSPL